MDLTSDSLSPQVASAAKLPILNPNEFDLWKMRIEQYFLMTDYSLWEVIMNGDSPVPTRVVKGVLQPVASTTAEQKLARKNELKARESLDQIHVRLKKLVSQLEIHERNKADLEEQSLDDLFNSLKIYEAKVKHSSSTGTTTQNLTFVSTSNTDSTTESVSATASVSTIYAKMHVSFLPNVDSLSNAVICSFFASQSTSPQLDNKDLKKIDIDDLKKGHFTRECRSPRDSRRNGVVEPQRRIVPVEASISNALVSQCLEFVEARLLVYKQNESIFEENIKLFNIEVQLRDNALVTLRQKLKKAEHERENDESWPPSSLYDRFQPSDRYHVVPPPYTRTFMPPKPDLVFNTAPTAVETDHPAFTSSEQVTSPRHSIKTSIPAATSKSASPKSASSGKRMNRKACFVCKSLDHLIKDCNYHANKMAQTTTRNHKHTGNHKQYAQMTHTNPQKHMVLAAVFTLSKPISITDVRPVSAAVPQIKVTRPRHANPIVTKPNSPFRRHITRSPSPKTSDSPPRVTAVKAPVGNPQHALQDKAVIDSRCSRHMTGNMSYLSDFKELNGNPKGGKISGKGKIKTCKLDFDDVYFVKELKFNLLSVSQICDKKNSVLFTDTECLVLSPDFKLPDESQVLLRVPRENNMYNVNLKNIVPYGDLTCLFAKATINESNLWHRRVLVTKPHNKTPYELMHGRTPSIGFMRPFGYHVTILNTLDSLGKFDGKVDEGFLVGYSVSSKAFIVFNSRIRIVQETKHVNFLGNKPNVAGSGPTWLFNIYSLTRTMNYQPVTAGNQTNPSADAAFDGKEHDFDAKKPESKVNVSSSSSAQSRKQDDKTKKEAKEKSPVESFTGYRDLSAEFEYCSDNSSNEVNDAGSIVPTVGQIFPNSTNIFSAAGPSNAAASPTYGKSSFIDAFELSDDLDMPKLEDITYSNDEDDVGAEVDFNNLETSIIVSPIPTSRVHKDHHMLNDDFHTCMFACFLSQEEPKRVHQALKDPSWIEAMQEELLQFKMQKDERGIVVRNKARLVVQGHTQEEGIDYEEVFAPVARIDAIRLFLDYASMGFMVYQIDVKSAFLYGTIKKKVYICQPPGFEDPNHPNKVYKVVKTLYGLHQAPRACQDKYVAEILRKFGLTKEKSARTPIDTEKPLLKDLDGEDVDVYTYMSMIGSLMYLTLSRPDIMFAQTVVATSSTEAEYVATASCRAQVLWIQNQLLDYGDSPLLGVNTSRCDEDRLELIELTVFLLPNVENVGIGVNAVDLQVSAVRHMLLLFSLTNWCCSLSAVRSSN
uniref:Putative ribonuclease H-like domain-containing protein n=1 Tax=Tanacetum cinerariifolium TaxID=118510 RepID=A0A6L2M306_TANCI|nr:putative ribonuclease H-like domain-containing protein [Tanacetum cinerariifolium]